jgi:hypothetical protein
VIRATNLQNTGRKSPPFTPFGCRSREIRRHERRRPVPPIRSTVFPDCSEVQPRAMVCNLPVQAAPVSRGWTEIGRLVPELPREPQGTNRHRIEVELNCRRTMKLRSLPFVLLLLSPSIAFAMPITPGAWSQVSAGDPNPFWGGMSGAGSMLTGSMGLPILEYLHDSALGNAQFRFDDSTLAAFSTSDHSGSREGKLLRNAQGAFTYDSGANRQSNSWTNPQQFALFRQVGPTRTQYFVGVENTLMSSASDRDYEYGATFSGPETHSVPEPSTLLLMGLSMVGMAAHKLRERKALRNRLS